MRTKKAVIAGEFGDRLRGLMKARGHISTGNASGVDVTALAAVAGSTYEMARRYVEGRAIPRADKLGRIAGWLGVESAQLLYGEEPKNTNRIIHQEVLQSCLEAARRAAEISGRDLSARQMAKLVALLYEEAIDGRTMNDSLIARLLRLL